MGCFLHILALIPLVMAMPVLADSDVIISDENERSILEGTVEDVFFDDVTLKMDNGSEVSVDISDLDVEEDRFDVYFPVGTDIKIVGTFNDDEFEAEHVIKDTDDTVILNPDVQ